MTARRKKEPDAESAEPVVEPEEVVHSLKGFDRDLKCRGFQFAIGETYEHKGKVEPCRSGFHAIEGHPLEVLHYKPPSRSRYADVTQSGKLVRHGGGDSKIASARITIDAEVHLPEIIQRAVKWVFDRANWKDGVATGEENGGVTASGHSGAATASGHSGAATASGHYGAATASGHYGAATASGDSGAATASGHYGAATASGHSGAATASGHSGAATASGDYGKVKGKEGCALFLVYRDPSNREIKHVWAGIAGRDGIKADTFYRLDESGNLQQVS